MQRMRKCFPSQRFWPMLTLVVVSIPACHTDEPAAESVPAQPDRPSLPAPPVVCAGSGGPAVIVEVRDAQGRPNALGAVASIEKPGYRAAEVGFGDSLSIWVGENHVGGTFDVRVRKPWHREALVRGVQAALGRCGIAAPVGVPVTLTRLLGAPPVRQVVAPPGGHVYLDGNLTARLDAHVEAEPGVSQEVIWTSRDTTVARVTAEGELRSVCRRTRGETWVIARAAADPSVQDSFPVSVHSANPPFGRCRAP